MPAGGSAQGGGGGEPVDGDDNEAGGSDAGESAGGSSGGSGSMDECQRALDCSDGDPDNGEETCFSGTCVAGNAPPTVLSVSPEDAAEGVEPDGVVVIEFSEPLDEDSVTAQSIQVLEGDEALTGKLSYADNKVTFTPDVPLALLGSYSVAVTTAVKDAAGAGMRQAFGSEFSVRDGAWKTIDVAKGNSFDSTVFASGLPITGKGDVLLAWGADFAGSCPMSVRWFSHGAALTPLLTFSDVEEFCYSHSVASNMAGTAVVTWFSSKPTAGLYARQFRDGAWQDKSALVSAVEGVRETGAAVTPAGISTVFQTSSGAAGREAWRTDDEGAWLSSADPLSSEYSYFNVSTGFDALGNGVAVWLSDAGEDKGLHVSYYDAAASQWSKGVLLSTSVTSDGGQPLLAVAPSGEAVALWFTPSSVLASYFAKKVWSKPEPISAQLNGFNETDGAGLVYDGRRFIAALEADDGKEEGTYTLELDPKTGWTLPERRQAADDAPTMPGSPRLVSDGKGTTLLVWAVEDGANASFVYQRRREGAWGSTLPLPGGTADNTTALSAESLGASMNASGMAAVGWLNRGPSSSGGYASGIRLASFY
jgi:hypothetical protein